MNTTIYPTTVVASSNVGESYVITDGYVPTKRVGRNLFGAGLGLSVSERGYATEGVACEYIEAINAAWSIYYGHPQPPGGEICEIIETYTSEFARWLHAQPESSPLTSLWDTEQDDLDRDHPVNLFLGLLGTSVAETEIIQTLNEYGRERTASRIQTLYEVASEEPSEDRIEVQSLRSLAKLLIVNPKLPHPQISVSPAGHIIAEWEEEYGILAMEFTTVGRVRFAALPRKDGYEHLAYSGEMGVNHVMRAIAPFVQSSLPE